MYAQNTNLKSSKLKLDDNSLVQAIRVMMLGAVLAAPITYIFAAPAQSTQPYAIAAGQLGDVLADFAMQSHVALSFDPKLTQGLLSSGLQGAYNVQQGFLTLLAGTNLQLVQHEDASWSIREKTPDQPQAIVQLATIQLKARSEAIRPSTQTASDVAELPVISLSARPQTARTEGSQRYTTPKVTTGKFEQSLRETPQSMSVMTRKQLDDQNISNLKEAMTQATGVTVTSNGAFAETGYQMRGYQATQQQDGLSVGANDSYSIAPARDMEIYDRIEILRGPAGLLEGNGDPSGVINMVRRRPTAEPEGFVNLSYGSWNNMRVSVGANDRLTADGRIRGRAILTHQQKDFFYDSAEEHRNSAYAIVEADVGEHTLVTSSINYSQSDSVPFYGWPPRGGDFSRKDFFGADWNKTKVPNAFEARFDIEHALNDAWKVKFASIYQDQQLKSQMAIATTPNAQTQRTSYYGYKKDSRQVLYGGELSIAGKFELFDREHDLIFGGTWSRSDQKIGSSTSYDNPDRSEYWNSDFLMHPRVDPNDIPDPNLNKTQTEVQKSSLYGAVKYKLLDDLTLTLGGRFSNYDEKSRGIGAQNSSDWEKSAAKASMEFTPYAGLVWNFSKDMSWYVSYTDIFSPQTQKEWTGATVKPRVGWQVETGVKAEFFDGDLQSTLAVFRLRDENRATVDRDPSHYPNPHCQGDPLDIATLGCSIAGGENQTQGVELELVGKLTEQWDLIMSYIYTDSEVIRSNSTSSWDYAVGSNFSPSTPKHAVKLWSTYNFNNGWNVGGGLNAQSHLYDSTTNQRNAGFSVFNAHIGYKVNPQLDVALNINNLFDKHYFASMGYAANRWMYGEPRNFMLSLRSTF
ncbi:TonB-dependent siderophore receptor [Acinetobacter larvae]|uniref:Secretin/TonB short N-terminal domain-containing protein n=1 Tax=Acinetobacter larvae TaxID=1789224 RepID=A0A1B2LYX3_9GAMM|nr:TonB-dependent receptor [Acinetobacter larvae]AOA58144.1 hypothetical protein BFG52_07105 [Acinetobacter larvae]